MIKDSEIQIDTSVYKETVEDGMKHKYLEGTLIKNWLEKHQIPIMPVDVSEIIFLYRNPGETSCAILVSKNPRENLCITSDKKTFNKFERNCVNNLKQA